MLFLFLSAIYIIVFVNIFIQISGIFSMQAFLLIQSLFANFAHRLLTTKTNRTMKRVLFLASIVIMAASAVWGQAAKIQAPELKTEKVFGDAFSPSTPPDDNIIGEYTGYSIEWPVSMGSVDLTALQNAVGLLALPTEFSFGDDIHKVVERLINNTSSLPVPQELNTAFFDATDYSWMNNVNLPEFYYDLTLVQVIDKVDGAYVSYRNSRTAYAGATGWIYYYDLIFDLVNNEPMELNKKKKKGTEKALVKKIVKQLIKDYKVKDYKQLADSLGLMYNTYFEPVSNLPLPPLPQNINYCKGNFIFTYNPYDIAPGGVGKIIAVIPAKDLKKQMTDKAKRLFGIK